MGNVILPNSVKKEMLVDEYRGTCWKNYVKQGSHGMGGFAEILPELKGLKYGQVVLNWVEMFSPVSIIVTHGEVCTIGPLCTGVIIFLDKDDRVKSIEFHGNPGLEGGFKNTSDLHKATEELRCKTQ